MYRLTRYILLLTGLKGLFISSIAAVCLSFTTSAIPLHAEEIILSIRGMPGKEEPIDYSMRDIEAMATIDFVTSTPWTNGPIRFTGIPLSQFVYGQDTGTLRMRALNDFVQNMPLAEIGELSPIVAFAVNGKRISVRDKGPLWVVYPFDSDIKFQTETIYARSVWQLRNLIIIP